MFIETRLPLIASSEMLSISLDAEEERSSYGFYKHYVPNGTFAAITPVHDF
jgi:hypothetical protein